MEVDSGRGKDAAPNQTIYVRNLNEKLRKEELRRVLYECFSPYGRILEIVALKTQKMRGQAFVAFEDVASAANAMRHAQGMVFYEKQITVQFAREKCLRIKGPGAKKGSQPQKKKLEADDAERAPDEKRSRMENEPPSGNPAPNPMDEDVRPNKILFIQNIPDDVDSETLEELFSEFRGFVEVRSAAGRKGIAFLEFDNEDNAEIALKGMQGFKISGSHALLLSYAKS
ncbi:hypothetical protein NDN08_003399 [Rhodosorus marinus]|uniref:RRM domain-containing protein n=1 Tax=Rhodosorus marinus TaxID=101924 RepID=A0AAV8UWD5_9RHOD|nr:hypothetical protein NDN08_003399 [Rhodosorus marinus]